MNKIKVYWWNNIGNAGDYYSKWLIEKITGKEVEHSKSPDIVCSGSILADKLMRKPDLKIWGVGFHNYYSSQENMNPDNYYAVRGKLTLDKLNFKKDLALGDPGLLLSRFYSPTSLKTHSVGIITHYSEYEEGKRLFSHLYPVINMETLDIEGLAEEINKCEFIYSTSLHGIIFAHSLGIPAMHLEINELASKQNFKFKDYYSVLDIEYKKITLDQINTIGTHLDGCVPDNKLLVEIQNNLLRSLPL